MIYERKISLLGYCKQIFQTHSPFLLETNPWSGGLGEGGCVPGREGYTAHFQQYMQGELEGLSSSSAVVDKLFFVPDEH